MATTWTFEAQVTACRVEGLYKKGEYVATDVSVISFAGEPGSLVAGAVTLQLNRPLHSKFRVTVEEVGE